MPRPGPRRPMLGIKVHQEDLDALDALAEKAGVTRSDVARVGLAWALHDVDEETLIAYLAAARDQDEPQAQDELRRRLLTSESAIAELGLRARAPGHGHPEP